MFGKRKRQPEPQQRIFPASAWQGQTGEMLKQLGMSPNDPSNLMPNGDSIRRKMRELQEAEASFVSKINSQLPENAKVAPFSMIPIQCWEAKENFRFLYVALDRYPFGPWNLLLLPENDMGELILGLPKHPRAWPKEIINVANANIQKMESEYMAAYQQVAEAMKTNDMSKLELLEKAKLHAMTSIETMAIMFATKLIGNQAFIRSKEMFFGETHWKDILTD